MSRVLIPLSLVSILAAAPAQEEAGNTDVRRLLRDLESGSPTERVAAATVAGNNGVMRAKRQLIAALRYEDPNVQEAVLTALNSLGATEATRDIRRFLFSSRRALRVLSALALMHFDDEASYDTILQMIEDENPELRLRIVRLFQICPQPFGLEALQKAALEDADFRVRETAMRALSALRLPSAEPTLLKILASDREDDHFGAIMALATIAPENHRERLLEFFHDETSPVGRRVVAPLSRAREPEVEKLLLDQGLGSPQLNHFYAPEPTRKLWATRVPMREIRWISFAQAIPVLEQHTGMSIRFSPKATADADAMRLKFNVGFLGYRPALFDLLSSLSPEYWTGMPTVLSFIVKDDTVVLVPPSEAIEWFKEQSEKKKGGGAP